MCFFWNAHIVSVWFATSQQDLRLLTGLNIVSKVFLTSSLCAKYMQKSEHNAAGLHFAY